MKISILQFTSNFRIRMQVQYISQEVTNILVVGGTQTGKSTLIKHLGNLKDNEIQIGDGTKSCTKQIQMFRIRDQKDGCFQKKSVNIYDTIGFGDTNDQMNSQGINDEISILADINKSLLMNLVGQKLHAIFIVQSVYDFPIRIGGIIQLIQKCFGKNIDSIISIIITKSNMYEESSQKQQKIYQQRLSQIQKVAIEYKILNCINFQASYKDEDCHFIPDDQQINQQNNHIMNVLSSNQYFDFTLETQKVLQQAKVLQNTYKEQKYKVMKTTKTKERRWYTIWLYQHEFDTITYEYSKTDFDILQEATEEVIKQRCDEISQEIKNKTN